MKVEVHPWSPFWSERFQAEKSLLEAALVPSILAIHHIGSTAVPHLSAKPVIDILLATDDLSQLDSLAPLFEKLGYEVMGEFGLPGRRYYRKGGSTRSHHLHAFRSGSPDIHRHLAFRDFLMAHPEEREAYAVFKTSLATSCGGDWESYCEGKAPYATKLESNALAWAASLKLS